jgi:hypothetical protein
MQALTRIQTRLNEIAASPVSENISRDLLSRLQKIDFIERELIKIQSVLSNLKTE